MNKMIVMLMVSFISIGAFAQIKDEAARLVDEGIGLHDKGDYVGAVAKYDKALALNKDNLLALAEKAYSLTVLKKYDEAMATAQAAITAHPGVDELKMVYVTYGNAADGLKQTEKSIAIYDEGIKSFPDFYLLYFNKGITLSSIQKDDEAMLCFQKAVMLNNKHTSSHNAIARLSEMNSKRIPALLAYARYLALDPQSGRAQDNLSRMQKLLMANVEETGKKSVTINISADMLSEASDDKAKENNFASTDLVLSMAAALDFDKENRKKTDVEQFLRKFKSVCSSMKETKKDNFGFFWNYYAPYFIQMEERGFLETYAYIVFSSTESADVSKWLSGHSSDIDKFLEWSKSFEWNTN